MIYVLLANGFEELEALAPVDLLRRAGCDVRTVAIACGDDAVRHTKTVCGAHSILVQADLAEDEVATDGLEAVILPGGMPGTTNLERSETVQALLSYAAENNLLIGAICAAPSILGHKGLLRGKRAVCYPGFEKALDGALSAGGESVVVDGTIVTAKGAGVATEFALELVRALVSDEACRTIREGIQCK